SPASAAGSVLKDGAHQRPSGRARAEGALQGVQLIQVGHSSGGFSAPSYGFPAGRRVGAARAAAGCAGTSWSRIGPAGRPARRFSTCLGSSGRPGCACIAFCRTGQGGSAGGGGRFATSGGSTAGWGVISACVTCSGLTRGTCGATGSPRLNVALDATVVAITRLRYGTLFTFRRRTSSARLGTFRRLVSFTRSR